MQRYQEEYIANIKEIAELTVLKEPEGQSFDVYFRRLFQDNRRAEEKALRNMQLLREELLPVIDQIFETEPETLEELEEFAGRLMEGRDPLDVGLYCHIHQALLSQARRMRDRNRIIRELYLLGMGRYNRNNMLVGMEMSEKETYITRMRLCFAEGAAYLKYFEEVGDAQIQGYIIRSLANISLGEYKNPGAKVEAVRQTLRVLRDPWYREKAPSLPWDLFIAKTHQQMIATISYSKPGAMSAQDVADIMESAHIVYKKQMETAESTGRPVLRRWLYSYYAIEHFCGLHTFPELLAKVENLMDEADPQDFSENGAYTMMSLPAFYSQHLILNPEYLPQRSQYVGELYRRVLSYADSFPDRAKSELLFFYLRQIADTFVEVEGGVTYEEFLVNLVMRFCPELYVHSRTVGQAAAAICTAVMEEEEGFFDDIDFVRAVTDPEEKKKAVLRYALMGGILHDVGKLNLSALYSQTGREWLGEEYEMAQLHVIVGGSNLSKRRSTVRYADIACGHHRWYDGSGGYPETFRRLDSPYRQMVDVIAVANWLESRTDTVGICLYRRKDFEETVQEAVSLEGKRFSPLITSWLGEPRLKQRLKEILKDGRKEGYRDLYERRAPGGFRRPIR